MGTISDFFVATREDAAQYPQRLAAFSNGRPIPPDCYEIASYKRIIPPAPELLWAMLLREAWDPERQKLEHIYHAEDGSEILERFPEAFVHLLAALDDTELDRIAALWAGIPEVNSSFEEIQPLLRDLRRLAALASGSGKGLYLWLSL